MRPPKKYWQYARGCARWARETKQDDDRELFERMSKAWVHIAQSEGFFLAKLFFLLAKDLARRAHIMDLLASEAGKRPIVFGIV